MEMPAEVYATLAAVVEKYPHHGDDEDRRSAMAKAVATVRARHGERWVWKTEHQSLTAPSKDGIGYVLDGPVIHGQRTIMFIWDCINGATRKLHDPPLLPTVDSPRGAYVLVVPPNDWLDGDGPTPPPPPPGEPPPPGNTSDLLKRIGEAEQKLKDLEAKMGAAALDALDARQMAILLSDRIASLKLKAAPELPDDQAISTNSVWGHAHKMKARIVS